MLFKTLAVFLDIIPELSNKQENALRMSRNAVICLLDYIILLPKLISSEYHLPFQLSYLYLIVCLCLIVCVVATGVVNLPMPPLCSAFRITVDSHYPLAGQALCIMSTRWPYRRFLGLRNLGFSAATIQFCIS